MDGTQYRSGFSNTMVKETSTTKTFSESQFKSRGRTLRGSRDSKANSSGRCERSQIETSGNIS
jgi:hypothetical protein